MSSFNSEATIAVGCGWNINGDCQSMAGGLINDTFLVTNSRGMEPDYVLQLINDQVFKQPCLVMDNISRVVAHIRAVDNYLVPNLIKTTNGNPFYVDGAGKCWRLWEYIGEGHSMISLEGNADAILAGKTVARFQKILEDLPGPELATSIENFLWFPKYMEELRSTVSNIGLQDNVSESLMKKIESRASLANSFKESNSYIHGDCKTNNLIRRLDGKCSVLDLDTVSRGNWACDFGDLVRSGARVDDSFSLELYEKIAYGFVTETCHSCDAETLAVAPRYVALMLAVRFFNDHLSGDLYFKVNRRGENLTRALIEFSLFEQMESAHSDMVLRVARLL